MVDALQPIIQEVFTRKAATIPYLNTSGYWNTKWEMGKENVVLKQEYIISLLTEQTSESVYEEFKMLGDFKTIQYIWSLTILTKICYFHHSVEHEISNKTLIMTCFFQIIILIMFFYN